MRGHHRIAAAVFAGGLSVGVNADISVDNLQIPVDFSYGYGTDRSASMQLLVEMEPRIELGLDQTRAAVFSARLRLDAEDELEPDRPDRETYSDLSRPAALDEAGTLELRDAYLEQRLERGILRLGKQQIVWGRLDGIKVLDVVNPQTFREFILDDFGDSRIGLWSAYLDLSLGGWRAELAWLPDPTGHDIPEQGAWFELTAPRFRYGAPPGAPSPPVVTERDPDYLDDSAAGLRLSRPLGRIDFSVLAYSGMDHEPLGRVIQRSNGPALERFYRRREVYGASAETAFGPVALRAEAAYQPSRSFNTRGAQGLDNTDLDQLTAGIGADLQAPLDLFLNVQFLWDKIDDAPSTLVRPDEDRVVTAFLRRTFAYETLRAELRWYHSLEDHDDILRASLDYDLGDNTTVYLSGEWFSGTEAGLFGQFGEQDRVYTGIRHTF